MRRGPGGPGPGGPGHGPGAMLPGEKARDFKGTAKKLMDYMRPYWGTTVLVLAFAIGSTVFSIIGPKLMGTATNKLVEGIMAKVQGLGGIDFTAIWQILAGLAVLYGLSTLLSYVQGYLMSGVAMKISYNLRERIAAKIDRLPLKYFDRTTHGEVLSRVTNDVDTVSNTLNQSLSQIVSSVALLLGIMVMMLTISWIMTLAAILVLPISMVLIMLIVKQSQRFYKTQQAYLGHINGHVEEMYSGHLVMKAFNGEARSVAIFEELNRELYKSGWKSQFLSGLMMPLMGFVGNLGYVVVSLLGGLLAASGKILIGDILAFIQYVRQFNHPIQQVANIANVLQSTMAAVERVFAFLEEEEEIAEPSDAVCPAQLRGAVRFSNVNFGYVEGRTIISDFSVSIEPGQKVAIVGPTGAGKTTLVKLLMRFYELNGGSIAIDGVDITQMTRNDLRAQFGMVLQDTWLFNGTIRENVRFGRSDADDAAVIEAAQAAYADHFVHTLPHGYDMELNEEANNISQGQKQLLTIARAVLKDPSVLILDEATSSVDTRTEVLIQKAMARLMHGRTSFIIAHRLSTIRDADLILVMRDGDIVEQGRHEALLAAGGFYAELYNSQFEG
ncbi:MAG: ABC transporter ATP-binding protein [Clostridia bacterium]|nr:ABC transporter ATP-binding protein [Clostridia bacterium]